jgi:hypothetical protein
MTIALLCPTRGRPEQCRRMWRSVMDTADQASLYYSIAGSGYIYAMEYNDKFPAINVTLPESTTCYRWNMLAEAALKNPANKLFMLAADDMVFSTPCWDKALIDHYNALKNKIHVYALRDSRDENGTPHPIVTREYIEAMGYFLPPLFLHWHVDSWTVDIAKANGVFTHLKDYMLIHDKPSDRGQRDETHNRIRAMGWRERDQWVAEHCRHFLEYEKGRLHQHIHEPVKFEYRA